MKWTMPEWMLPFKSIISCHESQIESLYNDDGTNSNVFNNAPRALMCVGVKSQIDLLIYLHDKGLLKDENETVMSALQDPGTR